MGEEQRSSRFRPKMLHGERYVNRCVIMVIHPVLRGPLLRTFLSFIFSQSLQHGGVAVLIECLLLRSKILDNDTIVVEETAEHAPDTVLHKSDLLQAWCVRALPLRRLLLCFWSVVVYPTFILNDYLRSFMGFGCHFARFETEYSAQALSFQRPSFSFRQDQREISQRIMNIHI